MSGDPGGHGGRPLAFLPTCPSGRRAETRVRHTEVVDGPAHLDPMVQRQRTARQSPTTEPQRCQRLTARRVEPLDGRGVDDPIALRAAPERLDACRCADEADRRGRGPQAVKRRASDRGACLMPCRAEEPLVLARVDANGLNPFVL
jgi:hypothetical protein